MQDKNKTKEQLIKELTELRQHLAELKRADKDRKKEVLPGSREEIREVIDSVKDGIVLLDLTGKVTTINKRITESAGYTEKDVVGKRLKLLKMFPPKSIATMFTDFARLISGHQSPPYEVEVYTKTGEKFFIEIQSSLFREKGKKAGVVAVLRDITERKQLEALLLRERETFVTILQNFLYGVALLDKEGEYIYVNSAFTAITGYTLEDIPTTRDWLHKAYPDKVYRQEISALWKKDIRVGGATRVFNVVCKNGETKEIEFRPTVLDDGRAVVMLADISERVRAEEVLQGHREHLEELVTERTAALQAANEKLQQEIAERKQMEQDLRESEERFRRVVETMGVGLSAIDENGVLTYVNEYLAKMLGYSIDEMIGHPTIDFYYDEEHRRIQKEMFRKRRAGVRDYISFEVTWRRKDGQEVYAIVSPTPHFDADGRFTGSFAIHTDITERKRMEEKLRESEEKYRELINGMNDTAWVIDFEGNFIDVNNAAVEVLGYSREELLSMGPHDIDKTLDTEQIRALIKEMPTDKIQVFETTHTAKDGKVNPVEIKSSLVTYQGKRAILSIARDITERIKIEEELRESEKRFKMLAEEAPFGISIMAPDRSFEYLNPRFTEIFGYSTEEIPDKDTWFQKAYPDKAYRNKVTSIWKRDIAEAVRIGKENPRVFTVRCKDGQDKIVYFRSVDLKDGKQYQVYEDITVRARAEVALRASEERYRTLVDNIKFGITLIDNDHNIVMVNPEQSKRFKKPASEMVGKKCFQEFEKRDAVCPHCPGVQTMTTGQPAEVETEGSRGDGSRYTVRLQTFPVFAQDGAVTGFTEIVEDISERRQMEEELRDSEERFRNLVETMKVGLSSIDEKGVLNYVNEYFCKMLGYSVDEMIGRSTLDFYYDEETRKAQEEIFAKRRTGMRDSSPYEVTWRKKDGQKVYSILSPTPRFDADGRYIGSFAIHTEITERKRIEEALRESQQELQAIMDASPAAISWADLQGNIQYINRKHHELFGYTLKDIPTIDEWRRQADQNQAQQERFAHWPEELMEAHRQGRSLPPREMTINCKDGSIRYVTVEGAIVSNHNLVIYNDITERVRAEEVIRKLAYHDALTGLPNRVLFADRLNFAMSQAHRGQRRLAVMSLDLDRFKTVNDTFGHSVGDKLLHTVGKRLTGMLRKNDTISRTGGDEFSLLMPEIDQEKDTVTVAQKVLDVFQEPFIVDVHELHITTSIGIALYPDDGEDADTLLKHSDIAMYQAKQKGRNNYQRYTPI